MTKYDVSLKSRPIQTVQEHEACGDKGIIIDTNDYLFLGLCDGAGHGIKAAEASGLAVSYLKREHALPLDSLLENLHQELKRSRGAAINLAKIDKSTAEMIFSGIGNVGTRIFNESNSKLVTRDGVVGYQMPKPKLYLKRLKIDDIIIFYSDGIRDRISQEDYPDFNGLTADEISRITIDYLSKPLDDASCIAVKVEDD